MVRILAAIVVLGITSGASEWTAKYTEHCIAAVHELVRPPDKLRLVSEDFERDFDLVSVSIIYEKKNTEGTITEYNLRCEYRYTRRNNVEAAGMLLDGKRLRDSSVETINFLIATNP